MNSAKAARQYVDAHDEWAHTGIGHAKSAELVAKMELISAIAEHAGVLAEFNNTVDFMFKESAR